MQQRINTRRSSGYREYNLLPAQAARSHEISLTWAVDTQQQWLPEFAMLARHIIRLVPGALPPVQWKQERQSWKCRVVNGPCAELIIAAESTDQGILVTLHPPDTTLRALLQEKLPSLVSQMCSGQIYEIRISDEFDKT